MSNTTPESEPTSESGEDNHVEEPTAMKLDSPEVDHIELSQDGGETFDRKSRGEAKS